jgi:hypothetical protein
MSAAVVDERSRIPTASPPSVTSLTGCVSHFCLTIIKKGHQPAIQPVAIPYEFLYILYIAEAVISTAVKTIHLKNILQI